MKKRLISMLLTAGMLVSLVAGCGNKAEIPGASGDSNAAGTETASTNGEYPVMIEFHIQSMLTLLMLIK